MDDDVLRRGRPTCHVEYDQATALLVGDSLQSLAFETAGAQGFRRAGPATGNAAPAGTRQRLLWHGGGQSIDLESVGKPSTNPNSN
jgi:farnesyl diphosphate synthase